MSTTTKARPLFDREIVRGAIVASFAKLDPRHQVRNPVMFVVLVGSVLTTALWVQALFGHDMEVPSLRAEKLSVFIRRRRQAWDLGAYAVRQVIERGHFLGLWRPRQRTHERCR